jgi:hypothetical protein
VIGAELPLGVRCFSVLDAPVSLWWGGAHGRGHLVVGDNGTVHAIPTRTSRLVLPPGIEHHKDQVTIFYAPFSIGVLLEPDEGEKWLAVTTRHRRAVLDELLRQGHRLDVRRAVDAGVRQLRLGRA